MYSLPERGETISVPISPYLETLTSISAILSTAVLNKAERVIAEKRKLNKGRMAVKKKSWFGCDDAALAWMLFHNWDLPHLIDYTLKERGTARHGMGARDWKCAEGGAVDSLLKLPHDTTPPVSQAYQKETPPPSPPLVLHTGLKASWSFCCRDVIAFFDTLHLFLLSCLSLL